MKLAPAQLEAHLNQTLLPIYIVSGEELLLKNDALGLIRKAAKRAGFTERTRITAESGYDWQELHNTLYAGSLLAEKRIIELDFRHSAPNKAAGQVLQLYGENCPPDMLMLIDIGKIDDKISKSAWYKAVDRIGAVLTYWPIPREQLPQWIIQRAKKYKLQIDKPAADILTDYVEGNLIAAAQAIEKIYLLQPQQAVDMALIESVLSDESRFTLFDFIETAILGEKARTLQMLDHLKADGTDPILILWGLTRELRLLADLAEQVSQGQTYDSLFQKYRIFFKRQSAVKRFLSRFSAKDCWLLLSHAASIDRIIKGAAPGNPWDSLQFFALRLS